MAFHGILYVSISIGTHGASIYQIALHPSHVIKMFDDFATNLVVAINYEPLCDVKTLMGLTYIYVANVGGNTKFEQTCSK